ncbi:hypothetical protein QUW36_12265 [Clostridium cadaveris]|uniref:hypothetical protein n=1 Tax=Clostridium cadaveris TaxID=1529 RepID=UPI0025A459B9|nr:hypothetical protein [Clostridium cadaveris]MDM8312833.1 hypothetical protein [Clostridium cadaveris]
MKNKKVTLIPYGLISLIVVYFLDVKILKPEKDSTIYELISILTAIILIIIIVHAIRLIKQFFKDSSYYSWKINYKNKNLSHDKTEDELKTIFNEEKQAAKLEKAQKIIENRAEMERLRNAGRTVHPSEQTSYQTEPQYDNNVARCPKCGSTSITANKKGFSATKGVLGLAVSPLAGAIAGGAGRNKVMCTCLKCGHQWKAGKK